MAIYSHNQAYPEPLPERIRLSDGATRTDSSTYTAGEIADAGYVLAPDKPSFDPATHNEPSWNGSAWQGNPKTQEQLDQVARDAARTEMRESWDALPDYLRGPYRADFEAANQLLDEGRDNEALQLVQFIEPKNTFSATQLLAFNTAKATFTAAIEAL